MSKVHAIFMPIFIVCMAFYFLYLQRPHYYLEYGELKDMMYGVYFFSALFFYILQKKFPAINEAMSTFQNKRGGKYRTSGLLWMSILLNPFITTIPLAMYGLYKYDISEMIKETTIIEAEVTRVSSTADNSSPCYDFSNAKKNLKFSICGANTGLELPRFELNDTARIKINQGKFNSKMISAIEN